MGKHSFFVFYVDDEGRMEWVSYSEEEALVKDVAKQYEASKKVPTLVLRGEKLKVKISTQVLIEMEDEK